MFYIGVDPDMHTMAVAVVDDRGLPVAVHVVRALGDKGRDAVVAMIDAVSQWIGASTSEPSYLPEPPNVLAMAVEAQEIVYTARSGKNPRNLLNLSTVAGGVLAISTVVWPDLFARDAIFFPAPEAWKGQVPKHVHQGRMFEHMGWAHDVGGNIKAGKNYSGFSYPTAPPQDILGVETIKKADWKHVSDAIGLARYARDEWRKRSSKQQFIAANPDNSGKVHKPRRRKDKTNEQALPQAASGQGPVPPGREEAPAPAAAGQ